MHGIHKRLAQRLEALERRFGDLPEPETVEDQERRLELVRAALREGVEPEALTDEEAAMFEKIMQYAPIFEELVSEGIITPDGQPAGETSPDPLT